MNMHLATAGVLGLAFALSGQPAEAQKEKLSPEQKEYLTIKQSCQQVSSTVVPAEVSALRNYAVQGCVLGYYTAKNILATARKGPADFNRP